MSASSILSPPDWAPTRRATVHIPTNAVKRCKGVPGLAGAALDADGFRPNVGARSVVLGIRPSPCLRQFAGKDAVLLRCDQLELRQMPSVARRISCQERHPLDSCVGADVEVGKRRSTLPARASIREEALPREERRGPREFESSELIGG